MRTGGKGTGQRGGGIGEGKGKISQEIWWYYPRHICGRPDNRAQYTTQNHLINCNALARHYVGSILPQIHVGDQSVGILPRAKEGKQPTDCSILLQAHMGDPLPPPPPATFPILSHHRFLDPTFPPPLPTRPCFTSASLLASASFECSSST